MTLWDDLDVGYDAAGDWDEGNRDVECVVPFVMCPASYTRVSHVKYSLGPHSFLHPCQN